MSKILKSKFLFCGFALLLVAVAQAQDFEAYLYDENLQSRVPNVPALSNGVQIDEALVAGRPLNIQVIPKLSGVASLVFAYGGGKSRKENTAPFTVFAETGKGNAELGVGSHNFWARAHSKKSGEGKVLGELRLTFYISADSNGSTPETPKPAKDYDKMIAEQFVKGDRFAKKNAAHLAHNKKQYKWPAGRSKSNPHDCYIVSRAYHDHMKFYEKGFAPLKQLYTCP